MKCSRAASCIVLVLNCIMLRLGCLDQLIMMVSASVCLIDFSTVYKSSKGVTCTWAKAEEELRNTTSCLHLRLFRKRMTLARPLASDEPARLESSSDAGYNKAKWEYTRTYRARAPEQRRRGFPLSCSPCQTLDETHRRVLTFTKKQ